jgi:excisionase family DNA binding protein
MTTTSPREESMPAPGPTSPPERLGRWLSLGPASRLLGIDPDTLRRWADQGRVPAWTTPGGHRRFDRSAIERVATTRRRPAGQVLASLGASPERLAKVYRRHYASEPPPAGATAPTPADEAAREGFRRDGRRLIAALIDFLDADPDDRATRDRLEREALSIVDDQARRLADGDASLTEAVSGFVAGRQPFLAELAGLGRRRSLDPARLATLYGDASALLDRLLLRFIDAHQRVGG